MTHLLTSPSAFHSLVGCHCFQNLHPSILECWPLPAHQAMVIKGPCTEVLVEVRVQGEVFV